MLSAGRHLGGVAPQLLHSTCWAHILHLCAEEIRFSLNIADEFIAVVKVVLAKPPAKSNWLKLKNLYFNSRAIPKISDGLCNQIQDLELYNQDASNVWLLLSSVLQMVQSWGATCKKLTEYMNEHHPALNFWKEVQNLDPTLVVPENSGVYWFKGLGYH
ncbi:hypothetical protein ANN_10699 [Periplaneta americana]|uniref:Uncharacterized protein n=1 Tax=Periplaneta americana TaxID=6978 RepID=A0ABQ8T4M8_PERAM|nr:hypothetical protein ANN_10699 [Periplaneta americana]